MDAKAKQSHLASSVGLAWRYSFLLVTPLTLFPYAAFSWPRLDYTVNGMARLHGT